MKHEYGHQYRDIGWSDFADSFSFKGAWQTFKGYCCQKIIKWKNTNQSYSDLLPTKTILSESRKSLCQKPDDSSVVQNSAGITSECRNERTCSDAEEGNGMLWSNAALQALGFAHCLSYKDSRKDSWYFCLNQYHNAQNCDRDVYRGSALAWPLHKDQRNRCKRQDKSN